MSTTEVTPGAPPARDGLLRCVGIMLVVLGAVRLGFIAYTAVHIPTSALENSSVLLLRTIIVPATLSIATLAAGILTQQRISATRVLCIVICAICLIYQLWSLITIVTTVMTRPGVAMSPLVWILSPAYIVMYGIAVTVLARWRP